MAKYATDRARHLGCARMPQLASPISPFFLLIAFFAMFDLVDAPGPMGGPAGAGASLRLGNSAHQRQDTIGHEIDEVSTRRRADRGTGIIEELDEHRPAA